MPGQIRGATVADIPALFDVRTSVRENHLDLAQLAERGVTPESIARGLASEHESVWVVEEPGAGVVAFCMADARTGSVFALFVRSDVEGRGYGRALLTVAEDWLFGAGWPVIRLNTGEERHLRAHRLYRAAGWVETGPADHGDVRYEKRRAP